MKKWKSCLCVLLAFLVSGCGGARSIEVTELNGTVEVTKENETRDAYVSEHLVSGEEVFVYENGNLLLLIDADKHLYADANTKFRLIADGNKNATKTKILLEEGSVLCGIDEKLKSNENFEVETENALMAVRGTVFQVNYDNEGNTTVSVMEGEVAATYQSSDGEKTIFIQPEETAVLSGTAGNVTSIVLPSDETSKNTTTTPENASLENASSGNLSSENREHYVSEEEFLARIKDEQYDEEMILRKGRIVRFSDMYQDYFAEWLDQKKSAYWTDNVILLDEPIEYNGKQYDKVMCNGRILNDMNEFEKMKDHYFYLYGFVAEHEPGYTNADFDAIIELWGEYPPDYCVMDYIYLD